jgi:hypothetical protein
MRAVTAYEGIEPTHQHQLKGLRLTALLLTKMTVNIFICLIVKVYHPQP